MGTLWPIASGLVNITKKLIGEIIYQFAYRRENVTGCHLAAMTELPLVDKVKNVQRLRWKLILQRHENLPGGEVGKIMTNHRSA